jgi:hypothetical protein
LLLLLNKIVDYVLYKDIKGGLKTTIIEFYNNSIKDKYKNYLIIMDNAVIHRSKIIRQIIEESTKIKREHLKNYLKHSFKIYKINNLVSFFFSVGVTL